MEYSGNPLESNKTPRNAPNSKMNLRATSVSCYLGKSKVLFNAVRTVVECVVSIDSFLIVAPCLNSGFHIAVDSTGDLRGCCTNRRSKKLDTACRPTGHAEKCRMHCLLEAPSVE